MVKKYDMVKIELGYFTTNEAIALAKLLKGKSYLNLQCEVGICDYCDNKDRDNVLLTVSSTYVDATEEKLKEEVMYLALGMLLRLATAPVTDLVPNL